MKTVRKYIFCFLLLTTVLSCTEHIDITTDNASPRLVITGYITTEATTHFIQVSRTVSYFGDEKPATYSNAKVSINGIILNYTSDGLYSTPSNFRGEPGKTYQLEVLVDFDEDGIDEYYTAYATMPPIPILDSISLRASESNNPIGPPWFPFVHFMDVPGANHYGVHLYINNSKFSSNVTSYFLNFFNDKAAEGEYINFPVVNYRLQEEMEKRNDEIVILKPGDVITLELNLLSPEYFEFIRAAKEEVVGKSPLFAGPPANIPGNISGNALGIFGAYTVSRASVTLPSTPSFFIK